jgi:cell wall-associated NlpC family hydrolase
MRVRSSGRVPDCAARWCAIRGDASPPFRLSSALGLTGALLVAILVFGAAIATTEPAAIEAKRAELAQIQSQLSAFNTQVEVAAEAYNGARYKLGLVTSRIGENAKRARQNQKDLESSRRVLGERLRSLYATPDPSLIAVLLNSGSITAAADQLNLLDRVGEQDAQVVGGLREHKATLEQLRKQLIEDRATAASAVAAREQEKARVEGLLAQRQAVLDSASAELKGLLRAAEEHKAREAAAAAAAARQRQAEAAAASASTTVAPVAGAGAGAVATPSPAVSAPAEGSSANAAAAQYALQFLGVPYVWGGATPSGFDCSGLATYVFAKYGKSVPHYTVAIWNAFPHVSVTDLQVGDMVFFHGLGHMGIYLGGDQFVHAPHTGDVVKVSQLSTYSGYVGAVRA